MDLDELRSVRRTERQKDSLQHLRDSFYGDVADYIADRKAARSRAAEQADDPFSDPEVSRLTDEIEAAEEVVESIYERRVGKVVKLASFAAADMSADTNGLTTEEHDLFEDLVARIKRNRTTVLEVLGRARSDDESTDAADASAPETAAEADVAADAAEKSAREDVAAGADDVPPTPPDVDPDAPADADPGDVLADAMGETDDSSTDAAPDAPEGTEDASATTDRQRTTPTARADDAGGGAVENDAQRVTLRITSDVGQILGVDDREYDLATEDVVTLPTTNADPLVERGAAERLD